MTLFYCTTYETSKLEKLGNISILILAANFYKVEPIGREL